MTDAILFDSIVTLFAVKLVQPGRKGDIVDGVRRLIKLDVENKKISSTIDQHISDLREGGMVFLYAGTRYMLTARGQSYIEASGIKAKIDARRFYLLKETRKDMQRMRSDTRERPLQQWS